MRNQKIDYNTHIEFWVSSGISKLSYCRQHGLMYNTFIYHHQRKQLAITSQNFVELKVEEKAKGSSQDSVEVYLSNGSRLIFSAGSTTKFIHEVIFGC